MSNHVDLIPQEITVPVVVRNASPLRLYEDALLESKQALSQVVQLPFVLVQKLEEVQKINMLFGTKTRTRM